jgi:hypothetical protein
VRSSGYLRVREGIPTAGDSPLLIVTAETLPDVGKLGTTPKDLRPELERFNCIRHIRRTRRTGDDIAATIPDKTAYLDVK